MMKHPLLSDYSTSTMKIILQRLVEELKLTNILNQYLSFDSERKIDYILKQLILHKKPIPDKNIFWKQVGHTVNTNHKLMSIIVKHRLLSDYEKHPTDTKEMLHKLVEKLKLNNLLNKYLSIDSNGKIDYILKQLTLRSERITDHCTFWKQIGNIINNDHKLMSIIITKHTLLSQHTNFQNKTILERLVEELQINKMLETFISTNQDVAINHLLNQVKECEEKIDVENCFWNYVGSALSDVRSVSFISHHSVLWEHCAYKDKTVLQRLVEELKIMNVLEKYILNNPKTVMDQLLNQVKQCEEKIDVQNIFWNRVSRLLNNDKSILFSLHHSLLWENCGYKDKTVLQRLVEELKIMNVLKKYILNNSKAIDHLLNQVKECEEKIDVQNIFWNFVSRALNNDRSISFILHH
eukprot:395286_1